MRHRDPPTGDGQSTGQRLLGRLWREDRAVTLAFTAVAGGVLLGAAAIAVDLGMLTTARVQAQRAADAGALAGVAKLVSQNGTSSLAKTEAKDFANMHNVLDHPVEVKDGDVDISNLNETVTVRVRHEIGTFFARILGIGTATISATATAKAVPAGTAICPLPIMAVDRWIDDDADGLYDEGEYYDSCADGMPCTGYSTVDEGLQMEIKSSETSTSEGTSVVQTCAAENPEWYCWIDNTVGTGDVSTEELEDILFNGCEAVEYDVSIGNDLESSPGNKQSVMESLKLFIDENGGSSLAWHDMRGCVWNGSACVETSHPRIRAMPVTDPTSIRLSGENATATVENFIGVFLEKVSDDASQPHGHGPGGQWNLYVRLLDGSIKAVGGGGNANSLLKSIVLVE